MIRLVRITGFLLIAAGIVVWLTWAIEPLRAIWPWLRQLPLPIQIGFGLVEEWTKITGNYGPQDWRWKSNTLNGSDVEGDACWLPYAVDVLVDKLKLFGRAIAG